MDDQPKEEEQEGRKTAADVARKSGVSIYTVARAFSGSPMVSDKTRWLILETAKEIGYRPAAAEEALRMRRSGVVGFVRSRQLMCGEIYQDMCIGLETTLTEQRLDLVLPGACDEARFAEWLGWFVSSRKLNALAVCIEDFTPEIDRTLKSLDIPVVRMYHVHEGPEPPDYHSVGFDTYGGIAKAVRYLVQIGHREIAFFNIMRVFDEHIRREQGFRDTMRECGVEIDESLVIGYHRRTDLPAGAAAFDDVFSGPGRKPTAIVCAGDIIALGALSGAARWNKLVPGDISVTGFDDYFWMGYYAPSVTTVRQSGIEMGVAAAKMILEVLDNPSKPKENVVLPTQLIVRQSTAPPRTPPAP